MGDGYSIATYIDLTFWVPIAVFCAMTVITLIVALLHPYLVKKCYEQYVSLHIFVMYSRKRTTHIKFCCMVIKFSRNIYCCSLL